VTALRERCPELLVETLVGDFRGRQVDVATVLDSGPDVFAHNIEVVRRLTPTIRDARCRYDTSLAVLAAAKRRAPERFVKSSIMVGLGEELREVLETLSELRGAGVDIVTLGQYLQPTPKHAEVARYVTPAEFEEYEREAKALGFAFVASGALVRSSYHAAEGFVAARLEIRAGGTPAAPSGHDAVRGASNAAAPPLIPVGSLLKRRRGVSDDAPPNKSA
jgi:lipoic acid synthetase